MPKVSKTVRTWTDGHSCTLRGNFYTFPKLSRIVKKLLYTVKPYTLMHTFCETGQFVTKTYTRIYIFCKTRLPNIRQEGISHWVWTAYFETHILGYSNYWFTCTSSISLFISSLQTLHNHPENEVSSKATFLFLPGSICKSCALIRNQERALLRSKFSLSSDTVPVCIML